MPQLLVFHLFSFLSTCTHFSSTSEQKWQVSFHLSLSLALLNSCIFELNHDDFSLSGAPPPGPDRKRGPGDFGGGGDGGWRKRPRFEEAGVPPATLRVLVRNQDAGGIIGKVRLVVCQHGDV